MPYVRQSFKGSGKRRLPRPTCDSGQVTTFTLTWHAAAQERFAPGSLDGNVGRSYEIRPGVTGILTAVKVADDGRSAELTIETDADLHLSGQLKPGDLAVRPSFDVPLAPDTSLLRVRLPQSADPDA